jgi:hypothetical protein
MRRWGLVSLVAMVGALALACGDAASTRWDDAAEQAEQGVEEPAGEVSRGGSFNMALPPDGHDGTKRVFTQEKEGYAEAEYKKDGQTLVTVSVSDTNNNPTARDKFGAASEVVAGHPVVDVGANSTQALVADRFQVRVSSPTLGPAERRAWLQAADLSALTRL